VALPGHDTGSYQHDCRRAPPGKHPAGVDGKPDSLIDTALEILVLRQRATKRDAFCADDDHNFDEADGCGDLASLREAAGAS
jgi:hypothetical protein